MNIIKSCSPKYTDKDIQHLSGTTSFVSFERLLKSIEDAIGLKADETIVGLSVTSDGIRTLIEKK